MARGKSRSERRSNTAVLRSADPLAELLLAPLYVPPTVEAEVERNFRLDGGYGVMRVDVPPAKPGGARLPSGYGRPLRPRAEKAPLKGLGLLSHASREPKGRQLQICQDRQVRKEVMHALGFAGKGAGGPYRPRSKTKC